MSARSGSPTASGLGSPQRRLDRADEVVAEEADRAAAEGRQVLERGLAVAADLLGRDPVGSPSSPRFQRMTLRGRTPMNE
jgi:hypothetical protein